MKKGEPMHKPKEAEEMTNDELIEFCEWQIKGFRRLGSQAGIELLKRFKLKETP